jgi:molybdopterin-guanine dinucleotide biosynthesis protein A
VTAFTGVVLTGGASRRMGTDKATLVVDGVALARRVADALVHAGADEVFAVGGDRAALAELGLNAVDDRHPGEGPLGAVITALAAARRDVVVVLGCDLPAVSSATVARLADTLTTAGADAAVTRVDDVPQVVVASYRRRVRPTLEAIFAEGGRSLRGALEWLDVTWVDDVHPGVLVDLDGPDDVRRYAHRRPPTANGSTSGRT